MTFTILHGKNLDILPTLPDNSVDSIVTDPPYELGFMGKKWDSSGIAYSVQLWTECLRVLKPGGHLLSFGGTRTYHRVAVAIEDAGFQIRDNIAWLYGSGFPKSLDVSKAIDKGTGENEKRRLEFVAWMKTTGLNAKEINEIIGKADVGSHYLRLDQPAIATADLFDKLRPYLPEVPEAIERLVAERTGIEWTAYKNRAVLGSKPSSLGGTVAAGERNQEIIDFHKNKVVDITAPSTPEAEQWEGWGTALKPAHEPIIVARKPLEGTVAHNVLTHGTGALNIDGSRTGTSDNLNGGRYSDGKNENDSFVFGKGVNKRSKNDFEQPKGRWPANIILDEHTAGLLDEQSDASRFFYVAKASKRDRNEGLEDLPFIKGGSLSGGEDKRSQTTNQPSRQNFHPTVKPTALMEYLVKLVTPPNGTVLDPFTGSGSTGKAAILNGFDFIGIEMTEDYLPIIKARLKHAEATYGSQIRMD